MSFHPEAISDEQRSVLRTLSPVVTERGFYLGGGTAVAQRGSRKDFVDIYALLRNHRPLPGLLERYRRRYDVKDVGHVVTALAYFDEAEPEPMPVMLWDVDWSTVREAVLESVEAYAGDV